MLKGLTALDILHESGLINLFGKFEEVDKFEVSPVLLRKGQTKLALYGIGSQRDDRLCRAFRGSFITPHFFRTFWYIEQFQKRNKRFRWWRENFSRLCFIYELTYLNFLWLSVHFQAKYEFHWHLRKFRRRNPFSASKGRCGILVQFISAPSESTSAVAQSIYW